MAMSHSTVADLLRRWQDNLADWSGNDLYLNLADRAAAPAIVQPEPADLFEGLIRRRERFLFSSPGREKGPAAAFLSIAADEPDQERLLRCLLHLTRWQDAERHEHGRNPLYLAFGLLSWRDPDDEPFRSPLLLLPVTLARQVDSGVFELGSGDDLPVLNPALRARLRREFQLEVPEAPANWDNQSLSGYLHDVGERLADLSGSRLETAVHLVALPGYKGAAVRDLEENADAISAHPLVRVLTGEAAVSSLAGQPAPKEVDLESLQAPDNYFAVLDADGGQRVCLEMAARGNSFVIAAAPGAGKRQTIVNLVADALAHGKRVLLSADRPSVLRDVLRRLERAGLGDLCQSLLHGFPEYGLSKNGQAEATAAVTPATLPQSSGGPEALAQCRDQLTAYLRALHVDQDPLKRSAWWALNEMVRLREVPALPLGLALHRSDLGPAESMAVVTEVSPGWLEEARQTMLRLQQAWSIRDKKDPCWWGFKAERYNKQLRETAAALVERVKARVDHFLAVAAQYGDRIGYKGPVACLFKAGELLASSPGKIAQPWLATDDLKALQQDVESCAEEYQRLGQARGPLSERYGPAIWQVPEGTAAQAADAWRVAAPLLPAGDERGVSLLTRQQALRGWAAETQKRIPGWIAEAHTLEKWLGIPLPAGCGGEAGPGKTDPSPAILRQLQRLANLCMSEHAPERTWVHDAEVLAEVRDLINVYKPRFAEYRSRRKKLLDVYTESLFDLELERLAAAFAGPYRSWLRIFNGTYRSDRRTLRRRTHAVMLPETLADDLVSARDLANEQKQLEAQQQKFKELLGRYEKGLQSDFESADRAQRIAVEAIELAHKLGCRKLPPRFVDVLCSSSPVPEEIQAAAKRLHDSLGAWQHSTKELESGLPTESLPGVGEPLDACGLTVLRQFARDLQASLNRFGSLTDAVLTRATRPPPDAATLVADLRQADEIRQLEQAHETEKSRWQGKLGSSFQGMNTDWNALRKGLAWAQRVRDFFEARPPELFTRLAAGEAGPLPSVRELRAAQEQYEQALHGLEIRFEAPGPTYHGKRLAEHPPEAVQQRLKEMQQRLDDLAIWIEWHALPTRFEHLGLSAFWEGLNRQPPPVASLPDVFLRSFLESWLAGIFQKDPVLSKFRRQDHERVLHDFQERDRDWIAGNGRRIRVLHDKVAPRCLLATPAQAGQLPMSERLAFDLTIIDGGQWLPMEEALSAICRGRQLVVIGDEPAAVNRRNKSGREPRTVLETCLAASWPVLHLDRHYRSRHDSLAAFSRQELFAERLTVFPSPRPDHPDLGIQFHALASGILVDGRNEPEARQVVELALAELRTRPDRSVGVVALAAEQRSAIEEEFDRRLLEQPELTERLARSPEPFFIKDAETIRDEPRDTIVLSVGFARDEHGRLPTAWDPLEREDGPDYLKAAVTLARDRMLVVSALVGKDIVVSKKLAPGVALLARFLASAGSWKSLSQPVPTDKADVAGPIVGDILRDLNARGYMAVAGVGHGLCHIDLAVIDPDNPGRYLLGIILDGPEQHALATASERDRLHPEMLQALGWRLYRIWSPDWVQHRAGEGTRLGDTLAAARTR
ncbi:MAG: DUF4011 domain-containing protein [Planctomycetes bacterium]|nr:DUF4011 domain-containing protein [Planctomycetota bacterium]